MESLTGQINIFAGNFPPKDWAFCDGKILLIRNYATLYSIIGTTYGGNGITNFALPDLKSSIPVQQSEVIKLGEKEIISTSQPISFTSTSPSTTITFVLENS